MNIRYDLKGTINNIGKLTHIKRDNLRKNVLSNKEIEEICNRPLSKILDNVVERIDTDKLFLLGLADNDLLERLCGENRKRKYVCSIYAGSTSVINSFEMYLGHKKRENIRRIGIYGFWHYFINLYEIDSSSVSLKALAEKAVRLSENKKVIDVMVENKLSFV